jgi:hypothetical protein
MDDSRRDDCALCHHRLSHVQCEPAPRKWPHKAAVRSLDGGGPHRGGNVSLRWTLIGAAELAEAEVTT